MTVERPFGFVDPDDRRWDVPAGAVIAGTSIPAALWSILGAPFTGKYRRASVVHDYFCELKSRPWQEVHKVFYQALLSEGVDISKARLMYGAVYAYGPRWETVNGTPVRTAGLVPPDASNRVQQMGNWIKAAEPSLREIASYVETQHPRPTVTAEQEAIRQEAARRAQEQRERELIGRLLEREREVSERRLQERVRELEEQRRRIEMEAELRRRLEQERRASNPCLGSAACTPVRVFFGTDRKQQDNAERVDFGPDRAGKLQLGRAIVTVPRAVQRKRGEIKRPTWWELVFQGVPVEGEPSRHFTIPKKGITLYASADDFLVAIREHMADGGTFKDHAFVFVHGYRMTFDAALYRTAQIAFDLGGEGETFGTAFLYSWPSGGDLKDYKYDFDSARLSTEHLESFVNLVIAKTGAKHLHLIAHSMGNWPMLAVLEKVAKAAKPPPEIDQIILAAPDIDATEFSKMAASIVGVAKGVTLYASSNDLAMKAARELHRGAPRAGDIPDAGPVVLGGVDTIDVSFLSTEALATGHAEYAERRELLNDIALILRNGKGAPNTRMPILEKVQLKDKVYWRYPN